MARRITPRRTQFLNYYFGEAMFNATQAARLAGFGKPQKEGSRLLKLLADEIANKEQEIASQTQMSAKEVVERLTSVARDSRHKDHVRALELLAKIHGQLSEKVVVHADKKALMGELDSTIAELKKHAKSGAVLESTLAVEKKQAEKEGKPN